MLIELQRIPYTTKGMGWDNFDNWLDWDKKNINPLREVLHKAEKELGEITNPYERKDWELGTYRGFSTMGLKELKELRERVPNKYAFDIALKKLIEIEIEWEKRFNGLKEIPKDYEWGENHLDIFKAEEWLKQTRGEIKMIQTYTNCPITFMIYGQNKQPAEFEKLDNEKFIDENGIELWDWTKPLGDLGNLKQCHSYTYYKADDTYLLLLSQGSTTEHKWLKGGCVANYGGSWGGGGCIQQYQDLEMVEQNYKEKNEGKSYSCLKGFAKIFMTERAWAVAKLIKERKVYIPKEDFFPECKTIKEKADMSIEGMKDYYLFMYDRDSNTGKIGDFKFWIIKSYGEERFNQEYAKAKQKALPKCFEEQEKDLAGQYGRIKNYLEYKEKDSKYAQSWLKHSFEVYINLKRIAGEMGKTVKTFNEYKEEVREGMKQRLAEKLKKECDSEMAKEVLTEMAEGKISVEEGYIDEALDDELELEEEEIEGVVKNE